MISLQLSMTRLLVVLSLMFSVAAFAQTPPPLYETGDGGNSPDLAIGGEKRLTPKPKPKPKEEVKKEEPKTEKSETKMTATGGADLPAAPQGEPDEGDEEKEVPEEDVTSPVEEKAATVTEEVKPIELEKPKAPKKAEPAFVETPAAPAAPEPQPEPDKTLPKDLSVLPVETKGELPGDGGPGKDAGQELISALPITFSRYEDNYLSNDDLVDVYKIYARAGEGLGFIIIPSNNDSQLAVDILGPSGDLLSQTQAQQPGQALTFQTSPIPTNSTLFIRIQDTRLLGQGAANPQLRKYSLELKPIAAPQPPAASFPPSRTAETTQPATPEASEPAEPSLKEEEEMRKKEEKERQAKALRERDKNRREKIRKNRIPEEEKNPETSLFSFLEDPLYFYGIIGAGVLLLLFIVLLILRKRKKGLEEDEEEEYIEVEEEVVEGGGGEEPIEEAKDLNAITADHDPVQETDEDAKKTQPVEDKEDKGD